MSEPNERTDQELRAEHEKWVASVKSKDIDWNELSFQMFKLDRVLKKTVDCLKELHRKATVEL